MDYFFKMMGMNNTQSEELEFPGTRRGSIISQLPDEVGTNEDADKNMDLFTNKESTKKETQLEFYARMEREREERKAEKRRMKHEAMANAIFEEGQALRECAQEKNEKKEKLRRIREKNRDPIKETRSTKNETQLEFYARMEREKEERKAEKRRIKHEREKMVEMQAELKRLNEQQLKTVQECSKLMLDQAEKQRAEMNEVNEARMREQRESAAKIEEMHERETGLIKGFAAAAINMTITQANAKENATIVELSNSLRDSLSETRALHFNAVEMLAQVAMNDFNFVPASIEFVSLGKKVDQVDVRRAEFVRALNRANIANKQIIAQQMAAIGNLEYALSLYRMAVGSLRAKMKSSTSIDQSDIDEFNKVQLELTKRMIEMPLIDANDVFGEIATNARDALQAPTVAALQS